MDAAMKPPWMGLRPEGSTLGVRRPQQGYLDSIVRVPENLLFRSFKPSGIQCR